MKKFRLLTLFFVLLLGVGVTYIIKRPHHDDSILTLYGNVDIREVHLAFRQGGRLASMQKEEGDQVEKGELLAQLDAEPYQEALAVNKAEVMLAEAELEKLKKGLRPQEITQAQEALNRAFAIAENAKKNYQRQKRLLPTGASSQSLLDEAKAFNEEAIAGVATAKAALSQAEEGYQKEDILAAEARLKLAKARLKQTETALHDTQLLAPNEGVISTRSREPGSMLTSQSTVYTLSLDKELYIRAYVAEPNLGWLRPGAPVRIYTDSSPDVFTGQVGFISPHAEFTPKTVETEDLRTDLVYRLRIIVADAPAELRQGMPVTIKIDKP